MYRATRPLTGAGKSRLTGIGQADNVETSFQQAYYSDSFARSYAGGLMPHNFSRVHGLC